MTIKPIKNDNGAISFSLFSGCSHLLFETQCFTAKQLTQAIEMAKDFEEELIAKVVAANQAA